MTAAPRYDPGGMETWVAVPGGRLFTIDEGRGSPVVLVHAAVADLRSWDGLAPLLVAAGMRVIRYDCRGFGRSESDDVPFSDTDDLLAVLDARGIARAAIVGNSRGATTALDAALAAPSRVVAVVAIGPGLPLPETPPLTVAERALDEEERRLYADGAPDPEALADLYVRAYLDGPAVAGRVTGPVRDLAVEMERTHRRHGPLAHRASAADRVVSRLSDVACPVLVVAGDLDFTDVLATSDLIAAQVPRGRLVRMPGVAHLPALEAPAAVATVILPFLQAPDRRT